MTRPRRYALIFTLLALTVLLGVGVRAILRRDREVVNEKELANLQTADLSQKATRDPVAVAAKGWPQFRGPNRDGWGSDANLNADWNAKKPTKLWETTCGGGYSSLAVANGRVYSQDKQGDDERVFCLDAATGSMLWEYRYPVDYSKFSRGYANGPCATPTVAGDLVFTVGATGQLTCLREGPGNVVTRLWGADLQAEFGAPLPIWGFASSPLIDSDLVIVQAGGSGSVVAFERTTGARRWAAGRDRNGYSSPVVATLGGVRQVVAVTGESIFGIRPTDGEVLWREPWETDHDGNIAMPVVFGDYVFVSSGYKKGCKLLRVLASGSNGAAAEVVYFYPNAVMRNHYCTCVHIDGHLYGFDDNELRCVDVKAGKAVSDWAPPQVNGRLQKGCLIAAGKHLIGLTQNGTLFIGPADPKEFALTGHLPNTLAGGECRALPALADGKLYLRDNAKVLCLDVGR